MSGGPEINGDRVAFAALAWVFGRFAFHNDRLCWRTGELMTRRRNRRGNGAPWSQPRGKQ